MATRHALTLQRLELALRHWCLRVFAGSPEPRVAVAYSGGADSTALLWMCREVLGAKALLAIHIHHGLQAAANSFAQHAEARCRDWGVALHVQRVTVWQAVGESLEACARQARYAALVEVARTHGVPHVLLAQHQRDQAETVLLALLRGAGVRGLAAMAPHFMQDGVQFHRPWLHVAAIDLRDLAQELGWVEDPTNQDLDLRRNRVRHTLLPLLREMQPGIESQLARSARLCAMAAQAEQDWAQQCLQGFCGQTVQAAQTMVPQAAQVARTAVAQCSIKGTTLDWVALGAWLRLRESEPEATQASTTAATLLHAWLREQGVIAREAVLRELLRQLERLSQQPGAARAWRFALPQHGCELRWQQGKLQLVPRPESSQPMPQSSKSHGLQHHTSAGLPSPTQHASPRPDGAAFVWRGEAQVLEPDWQGAWQFSMQIGAGIAREWLLGRRLQTRVRQGGERLQPHAQRPSHSLKNLYQERGIAASERAALPLLWLLPDATSSAQPQTEPQLLAAAGLGMDARLPQAQAAELGVVLTWQANAVLTRTTTP